MARESILIIDDNVINLKLVKVLLSAEGYKLKTAGNAKEALALLKTYRPNLILMDIQLPDMDGLTLTRQLRNDPDFHNIVILAITAFSIKGDAEKVMAAGCDGYISKPIDIKTFPSLIRKFLMQKHQETQK